MRRVGDLRRAALLALLAPALLIGGAYIAQFGLGLPPCEMCWWQRYPHFVAIALAGFALALTPQRGRLPTALAAVAIAVSGAIGAFHAGVEYGWWKGLTACTATAAAGGDPLAAILDAPLIRCDVAPWSLLGISLAGWNFLLSGAAALAIAFLLVRRREGRA